MGLYTGSLEVGWCVPGTFIQSLSDNTHPITSSWYNLICVGILASDAP